MRVTSLSIRSEISNYTRIVHAELKVCVPVVLIAFPQMSAARILIIDDEAPNLRLLERMLGKAGYDNLKALSDPRKAALEYEQQPTDLVLLDLNMPHLDGFQVLKELQERTRTDDFVPVLVLTADITAPTKLRALSSGAHDFLTKPFDQAEVLQRVSNLLKMRTLHREVQSQNARLEEAVDRRTNELQEALHQLRETQQQVIQQERLRALGAMASGVAHDFNNALSVILGFGEMLLQDASKVPGGEQLTKHARTIITAAQDGAAMVTRLREFYRPEGDLDFPELHIRLREIVKQAAHITEPRWKTQALAEGRQIDLVVEDGEEAAVVGDAPAIREALTNLIFNAVDAMPNGGLIRLETSSEGEWVVLRVSDTGLGMSEEVRRRCLEPFFTTKGAQGSGLGLAMVYGIVERHGGRMNIQSKLGYGTTFEISLPRSTLVVEDMEIQEQQRLERLLHILVIDDQPLIREILSQYLQHDWHTVDSAGDAASGFEMFKRGHYDMVIVDQVMPGISGEQLAANVREISPGTAIILLTGFGQVGLQLPTGVDVLLPKPVSHLDLRKAIAHAILAHRQFPEKN